VPDVDFRRSENSARNQNLPLIEHRHVELHDLIGCCIPAFSIDVPTPIVEWSLPHDPALGRIEPDHALANFDGRWVFGRLGSVAALPKALGQWRRG
jgi:hypothetical protein